ITRAKNLRTLHFPMTSKPLLNRFFIGDALMRDTPVLYYSLKLFSDRLEPDVRLGGAYRGRCTEFAQSVRRTVGCSAIFPVRDFAQSGGTADVYRTAVAWLYREKRRALRRRFGRCHAVLDYPDDWRDGCPGDRHLGHGDPATFRPGGQRA